MRRFWVCGRSTEEDQPLVPAAMTPTYDQADIRAEAEAFAAFIADAQRAMGWTPARNGVSGLFQRREPASARGDAVYPDACGRRCCVGGPGV